MDMIAFDKSIYRRNAVITAIHEFEDIAEIQFHETSKEYECIIRNSRMDINKTILEFGNYVLNLTVAINEDAK